MSINIAVDGPAGAGKSSIARAVAEEIGIYMLIREHSTDQLPFIP